MWANSSKIGLMHVAGMLYKATKPGFSITHTSLTGSDMWPTTLSNLESQLISPIVNRFKCSFMQLWFIDALMLLSC